MIAATRIDESSLHYRGWRVVLACFLMAFFMFGFGLYGQGVYLAELQRAHGWPGTLVSAASTFSFLLSSVLVIFTDDLLERIGLRSLILSGLTALGASTVLLALMQTPWQLYLAYALMSVGWTGMGTVVIATVLNSWFERRRGLALSLAFNGATCGGIILVPLLLSLTGSIGFRSAMLAATLAMMVLLLPVVVTFIGWPARMSPASDGRPAAGGAAAPGQSRKALLANAAFWTMVLPIAMALLAQMGFIIHQVTFLEPLIGRSAAGLAVTIMAAMAVVGRLSLGLFVDRLDPRLACAASMMSQAAALFVLLQSTSPTGAAGLLRRLWLLDRQHDHVPALDHPARDRLYRLRRRDGVGHIDQRHRQRLWPGHRRRRAELDGQLHHGVRAVRRARSHRGGHRAVAAGKERSLKLRKLRAG
ncbi:MFS family permease [Bradyrhizobium liaoningense]